MNCEQVRIAMMAIQDGEQTELLESDVRQHVSCCEECSRVVRELTATGDALGRLVRRRTALDLWPRIESRLADRPEKIAFTVLAILLAVYKIAEFAPSRDPGLWIYVAPIAIAAIFFAVLKQNPFQINAGLRHEGEKI